MTGAGAGGVVRRALRGRAAAPLLLAALVGLFFVLVETRFPYYFLQDDNRDLVLPFFVHDWRAVTAGQAPLFNFHQYLGVPHLANFQSAALSPFTYLSVGASEALWGHPYAAVDIATFLFFVVAALGMFFFLRRLGVGDWPAFFGAAAWPLAPFVVYVSTAWGIVAPTAAFFPWMLYFCAGLVRRPSPGAAAGLVAARLALFFAGTPQYFVYACIFELLFFALSALSPREDGEGARGAALVAAAGWYVAGWLLFAACSLPQLLPTAHQSAMSERGGRLSLAETIESDYPLSCWLNGVLWPFRKLVDEESGFVGWQSPIGLSHVGWPALLLAALALVLFFVRRRAVFDGQAVLPVAAIGALNFLWMTNRLWLLVTEAPLLERFRWPFKNAFFVVFALAALAAVGLHLLSGRLRRRWALAALAGGAVLVNAAGLFAVTLAGPQRSFMLHGEPVPLVEPHRDTLARGRVISVGYELRDPSKVYFLGSLGFNFPTLLGLYGVGGWDVLAPDENRRAALDLAHYASYRSKDSSVPVEYLRRWGVRWYIVNEREPWYARRLFKKGLVQRFREEGRIVFEDAAAEPLVRWDADGSDEGLAYSFRANEVRIAADRPAGGRLAAAVLYNPFFEAYVDGRKSGLRETVHGQLGVDVPPGRHEVRFVYRDPLFRLGWAIALAALLGAVALLLGLRRIAAAAGRVAVAARARRFLEGRAQRLDLPLASAVLSVVGLALLVPPLARLAAAFAPRPGWFLLLALWAGSAAALVAIFLRRRWGAIAVHALFALHAALGESARLYFQRVLGVQDARLATVLQLELLVVTLLWVTAGRWRSEDGRGSSASTTTSTSTLG